jgi:chemotaxis response regulator CheB
MIDGSRADQGRSRAAVRQPYFIALGASAGGLPALRTILRILPADLPAAVLIVLHRPVDRHSYLPEVLGQDSGMPVVEAIHGERFLRGCCYLGGPADHLSVGQQGCADLLHDPEGERRSGTIDHLFRSLAMRSRGRASGVVLTGMLQDGAAGLALMKDGGAVAMVQLPSEAQFRSMPDAAIARGTHLDVIGTLSELAAAVITHARVDQVQHA